ncbi:hypothetical protein SAMN05216498_0082 [Tenuibacillus multivorans]|uniref:Uncharacterized protein n=1 Tax=Tenuibacillus multivorans TaxID=237069 RepID=A0A1H0EVL5_9BACI|nr:hypothetical protein SAMN05216498_0082 [Tenuibacillus multivorans]
MNNLIFISHQQVQDPKQINNSNIVTMPMYTCSGFIITV